MQDMTAKVADTPKGWTLPSVDQVRTIGPDAHSVTYVSSFSPVRGGNYNNGTLGNEFTHGVWWGSTVYNVAQRCGLYYDSSSLYTSHSRRSNGSYVRCIQAS
ncbi:hypothetical protein IKF84_01695 [Candidatus Saccharibacteria bacterium]|nr:hypothetical protein [Candidatus Saccharibacteria bacterium]